MVLCEKRRWFTLPILRKIFIILDLALGIAKCAPVISKGPANGLSGDQGLRMF
jgi:hypothetical protein